MNVGAEEGKEAFGRLYPRAWQGQTPKRQMVSGTTGELNELAKRLGVLIKRGQIAIRRLELGRPGEGRVSV